MTTTAMPNTELDGRYSSPDATARPWSDAVEILERAEMYWITTIHPEGRPNVTPLIGLWLEGAFHFTTGEDERKVRNLRQNPHCAVITGCNRYSEGFDIVIEGEAIQVTDATLLQCMVDAYKTKYDWNFAVGDGVLHLVGAHPALEVNVADMPAVPAFRVAPDKALGFGRGETFTQTRWSF
jgi:general stress protein 26